MPVTYQKLDANDKIYGRMLKAMVNYHQPLCSAEVLITMLSASGPRDDAGEVTGPAIKVNGYAAKACVRITSLKDRAAGLSDAVIIVDGDNCSTWSEPEFAAILDHELNHLEVKVDEKGALVRDDLGRPKLRMRKHDFQCGWFADVAQRHKENSAEAQQLAEIGKTAVRQGWLRGF